VKEKENRELLSEYSLEEIAEVFVRIRKENYLIHMIPNGVSVSLCADGLAALGARPLMAVAPEEMTEIVSQADSCVINLGQLTKEKQEAAGLALKQGAESGKPLVLDPVGCGASRFRMEAVQELLNMPWRGILKGNRSEIYSIQQGKLTKEGIDSIKERSLTRQIPQDRVYLVTGETDDILWETGKTEISHREGIYRNLVGTGCLTGAVAGACYCAAAQIVEETQERSQAVQIETEAGKQGGAAEALKSMKLAAVATSLAMAYVLEQAGKAEGYGRAKNALLDALEQLSEKNFLEWLLWRQTCSDRIDTGLWQLL
jgi:hydroxyethylthiazole kinase